MLYQTALGVSIFDNSKISSVRFAQSIVFWIKGVMMESHEQDIHIKGTKLITNSKSLRNGFRFFHVVFILDTLNKRLSWDLQNSVRVVGGSGWWLIVPGNPITSRLPVTVSWPRSIGRNRLNHQLNSLQQWLMVEKHVLDVFVVRSSWSGTRMVSHPRLTKYILGAAKGLSDTDWGT